MYQVVEGNPRMTENEASERFPDSYIVTRMDSMDISNDMCTVLYIADNQKEAFSLVTKLGEPSLCGVSEGLNLLRNCLGDVVVGG